MQPGSLKKKNENSVALWDHVLIAFDGTYTNPIKTKRAQTAVVSSIVEPSRMTGKQSPRHFAISCSLSQHTNIRFRYLPWIRHRWCHETHDSAWAWKFRLELLNFWVNQASPAAGQGLGALYNTKYFKQNKLAIGLLYWGSLIYSLKLPPTGSLQEIVRCWIASRGVCGEFETTEEGHHWTMQPQALPIPETTASFCWRLWRRKHLWHLRAHDYNVASAILTM